MPRTAALRTLIEVDRSFARGRDVLDSHLERGSLQARDRDLARELTQGVLRRQETLDHLLDARARKPIASADPVARSALRLGAYQILFLDRVPVRAAVHTAVELVKTAGRPRAGGFVNAVLRKLAAAVEGVGPGPGDAPDDDPRRTLPRGDGTHVRFVGPALPDPATGRAEHLAARWSHPVWLVERFLAQHGEAAARRLLEAGITRPSLSLRPLAGRRDELRTALVERGLAVQEEGPCLLLSGAGAVAALPGFAEGWFAVQDPTSAEVVPALALPVGASVIELCAAPGGKTVALAETVGPDGVVLAVDLPGARSRLLRAAVEGRGLAQVAVLEADATDPENLPKGVSGRPGDGFDAALVDVPCSNTGVLGRRVEARRRLRGPDRIAMLAEQAAHLLLVGASRVRPGGRLAYATCSVDVEENQDVVHAFLDEDPDFHLVEESLTLPDPGRRDGGYRAVLRRE